MDALTQYGPLGGMIALAMALVGVISALVQQRRRNGGGEQRTWEAQGRPERRRDDQALAELRGDLRIHRAVILEKVEALSEQQAKTREDIHEIRKDILQPLVLRVALVERDVEGLKERRE